MYKKSSDKKAFILICINNVYNLFDIDLQILCKTVIIDCFFFVKYMIISEKIKFEKKCF